MLCWCAIQIYVSSSSSSTNILHNLFGDIVIFCRYFHLRLAIVDSADKQWNISRHSFTISWDLVSKILSSPSLAVVLVWLHYISRNLVNSEVCCSQLSSVAVEPLLSFFLLIAQVVALSLGGFSSLQIAVLHQSVSMNTSRSQTGDSPTIASHGRQEFSLSTAVAWSVRMWPSAS